MRVVESEDSLRPMRSISYAGISIHVRRSCGFVFDSVVYWPDVEGRAYQI